jgi:hypothetical protein
MENRSVPTNDYRTIPLSAEYRELIAVADAATWYYETEHYHPEPLEIEKSKQPWVSTLLPGSLVSWRTIIFLMVLPLLLGGLLAYFLPLPFVANPFVGSARTMHLSQRQPSAGVQAIQNATAMRDITAANTLVSPELQSAWTNSGHTTLDAAEATDVAATFTQRYQTLDYRSPATLSAARFVLTQAENTRFATVDERNNPNFIDNAQQKHLIQVASITSSRLVKLQRHKGDFFAWITVSYELYRHSQGQTSIERKLTQQVLLLAVPFGTPQTAPVMGGIGWLVCSFRQGDALPAIPEQP